MVIHTNSYLKLIDLLTPLVAMILLLPFYGKIEEDLLSLALLAGISLVLYSLFYEYYYNYYLTHMDSKLRISITSWLFSILVIFIYVFFVNPNMPSILLSIIWILITPMIILLLKFFLKKIILRNNEYIHKIIIIGNEYKLTNIEYDRLITKGYQIVFIKDVTEFANKYSSLNNVDRVVINITSFDIYSLDINMRYSNKIISMSSFLELYQRKLSINKRDVESILNINPFPRKVYLFKRFCDYFLPIIFSLPIIIILLFSFVIQKLQAPGRFFFLQNRVGKDKMQFKVFKIRTMYEKTVYDPYTRENDERIYPFGNKLRIYRFDEIPQIINVIKGDMHMIGPRAEWDILAKDYEKNIECYDIRSLVKPGITGWAQVMFRYGSNIEDSKQKLMYDLYYIKNWSIWLEFEIGIRTFMVIFSKGGL